MFFVICAAKQIVFYVPSLSKAQHILPLLPESQVATPPSVFGCLSWTNSRRPVLGYHAESNMN
jgi:hypothetical protein